MPIKWDNVDQASYADVVGQNRTGVHALQRAFDEPRRMREEQRVLEQHNADLASGKLADQLTKFNLEAAPQKLAAEMFRNNLLNQKTKADLTKSNFEANLLNQKQKASDLMSSPDISSQAWIPATKPGESGHWDTSIAAQLAMAVDPSITPEAAMAAAQQHDSLWGDTARDEAILRAEKYAQEEKIAKLKAGYKASSSGYNTEGIQADTIGFDDDSKAKADLDNNILEFMKKGLPKEKAFEAVRNSLNFRGAYNDRRGLPALEAALKKHKETLSK